MEHRHIRLFVISGMAILPLLWLAGWYLAFLINHDCEDALGKVEGIDATLYTALVPKCATASERLHVVQTWGLASLVVVETVGWWLIRRLSRKCRPH